MKRIVVFKSGAFWSWQVWVDNLVALIGGGCASEEQARAAARLALV